MTTQQATHCEFCGCLRDDHSYPEEVDDGIPFAIMSNGGDTEIITCGDCADCTVDPREAWGWNRTAVPA